MGLNVSNDIQAGQIHFTDHSRNINRFDPGEMAEFIHFTTTRQNFSPSGEMVYTIDLGSIAVRRGGSSPLSGTGRSNQMRSDKIR